jgi:hypothetical protein
MRNRNVRSLIVSKADGVLLGMIVNQPQTQPR